MVFPIHHIMAHNWLSDKAFLHSEIIFKLTSILRFRGYYHAMWKWMKQCTMKQQQVCISQYSICVMYLPH